MISVYDFFFFFFLIMYDYPSVGYISPSSILNLDLYSMHHSNPIKWLNVEDKSCNEPYGIAIYYNIFRDEWDLNPDSDSNYLDS